MLEKLNLSDNFISDAGGELLGISIANNARLKHLNLRKNDLRATSGAIFVKSLQHNRSLKWLKLDMNFINISFLEEIAKLIERNNLSVHANSVIEMREDRKGFLDTRIAKWNKVNENRAKFIKKTEEL